MDFDLPKQKRICQECAEDEEDADQHPGGNGSDAVTVGHFSVCAEIGCSSLRVNVNIGRVGWRISRLQSAST